MSAACLSQCHLRTDLPRSRGRSRESSGSKISNCSHRSLQQHSDSKPIPQFDNRHHGLRMESRWHYVSRQNHTFAAIALQPPSRLTLLAETATTATSQSPRASSAAR